MKNLIRFCLFLTIIVIGLGAYTRLSDAGLGCPDWPGCYGKSLPSSEATIIYDQELFLNDSKKAWIEMIHRYAAGILGLLILFLFFKSIINRNKVNSILSSSLIIIVILQAILGMLTVTMKLQPLIVCLHLLGGFSILALLFIMNKVNHQLKINDFIKSYHFLNSSYLYYGCFVLCILIFQIFLGGWVSANYAAPYCTGFPLCNNAEEFNLHSIFNITFTHNSYQYGVMNEQSRMSMHLLHRFMALITCLLIATLACLLLFKSQISAIKTASAIVLSFLGLQVGLGVSLIFFQFPLSTALLHNLIAAMLLLSLLNLLLELKMRSVTTALAID